MIERPIIFSGPMVRAILAGTKTQTRRVLKPQPPESDPPISGPEMFAPVVVGRDGEERPGPEIWGIYGEEWGRKIPYQPGDLMWVRETWADMLCDPPEARYRADWELEPEWKQPTHGWRSPIHMPRWASRISLRVTDVRVQRVQEITSAEAIAEGFPAHANSQTIDCETPDPKWDFAAYWDSIHPMTRKNQWKRWISNPWVVAITFERVKP